MDGIVMEREKGHAENGNFASFLERCDVIRSHALQRLGRGCKTGRELRGATFCVAEDDATPPGQVFAPVEREFVCNIN